MKNLSISLFVALLALALGGGCDKLGGKEPSGGSADRGSQQEAMGEAMAKAMDEAMAEAMAEATAQATAPEREAAEAAPAPQAADTSLVAKAREMARIRQELKANPQAIDEIFAKSGMTEDQIEELLFAIAEDPEASAVYAGAR